MAIKLAKTMNKVACKAVQTTEYTEWDLTNKQRECRSAIVGTDIF